MCVLKYSFVTVLQGEHMWRIRLYQIDTPGDNFSSDEIDNGAGNSTFRVIKFARMRGLEVRRIYTYVGIYCCA